MIRRLYKRDHLYQVLATFGLLLFSNEAVSLIFGRRPPLVGILSFLEGAATLAPGFQYPIIRLAFIAIGAAVALGLWWLVNRTRVGMLIRAGADDREMVDALGMDIKKLYTLVFGLGALLCGLAGVMAAPLLAVEIGMGERILITTFVVIVIGGVGSVRGRWPARYWWAWWTAWGAPFCRSCWARCSRRPPPIRWPRAWPRPAFTY